MLSRGTRLWYNGVYRTPVWCESLGRLGPDLVEQLISLRFSFILGKSPKNHNITETFLMILTFTQSKTSKGSNSKSGQNRPKLDLHQTTSRYDVHLKEFVRSDFSWKFPRSLKSSGYHLGSEAPLWSRWRNTYKQPIRALVDRQLFCSKIVRKHF